ncbi:MAG: tetraacyldisaccharide 4'-kinase [Nitrospiraceae bacterium]
MTLAVESVSSDIPAVPWWQHLAAWPYATAMTIRAALYRSGTFTTKRLPRRVISVGNLTVGGTGKTPVVIWLVQHLLSQGRRVAVLSRGYRRTSRAPQLIVSDGQTIRVTPAEGGDEPFLIARRCPRAIVAVGADRHALGTWVLERFQIDDFVLDDGFQHIALARDLNFLLVDATDGAGLAATLPVGRLREPLMAAARATQVLLTRTSETTGAAAQAGSGHIVSALERAVGRPLQPITVEFAPEEFVHIMKGVTMDVPSLRGRGVVAVSAIGNPASFVRTLTSAGLRVLDHVVFRDHHAYSALDISTVQRRAHGCRADIIVTTEKDACKLAELLGPSDPWWAVRIQARASDEARVWERLAQTQPPSETSVGVSAPSGSHER